MQKVYKNAILVIGFVIMGSFVKAQTIESPGEYMTYISTQYRDLMQDYMSYTSAVAHGKTARKIESKRKELIGTASEAIKKISAMSPYKGDKMLRDSSVSFLKMSHLILTEDYAKIVDMEEVSEQSYDAMEAYFLAQDLAHAKLKRASNYLNETEDLFVKKYDITLIEKEDELEEKLAKASKVNSYQRIVYLIFFKSYKQEMYLLEALNKKDINGFEQNKNALIKVSTEGLAKLDTMKAFNGDPSLKEACKVMLVFYNKEGKGAAPLSDFLIKEESFAKVKKSFDAKKESDRTQADVDQFNKSVNEMNNSANLFNTTNANFFNSRKKSLEAWNKTSEVFLDKHTPKYK